MGVRMLLVRDPKSQLFNDGHCQRVHMCTNVSNNHDSLFTHNVSKDIIGDTIQMCNMMSWLSCFNPFALCGTVTFIHMPFLDPKRLKSKGNVC